MQYMENLRDDDDGDGSSDGIKKDEIVQNQLGVHHVNLVNSPPSTPGVDIDSDGINEHSNIHIGELQWGTKPNTGTAEERPKLNIRMEVDYHSSWNASLLNSTTWRRNISKNYRLYGIGLKPYEDEVITNGDLGFFTQPPFSIEDFEDIEDGFRRPGSQTYGFIGSVAEDNDALGYHGTGDGLFGGIPTDAIAVFADTNNDTMQNTKPALGSIERRTRLMSRQTYMQEAGHMLQIGEADDGTNNEIRSGSLGDPTPERVYDNDQNTWSGWSPMRRAFGGGQTLLPTYGTTSPSSDGRYIRFGYTIEELTTISNNET